MLKINLVVSAILLSFFISLKAQVIKSEALKETQSSGKIRLVKNIYPGYSLISAFLLTKKANEGDPIAQHEIGLRHLLAEGFESDTVKAVYWIEKAAAKGLSVAEYNLGLMKYNQIGTEWDPYAAYKLFESAAEKDFAQAQLALGLSMTDNLIVTRNMGKAYELVKRSVDNGYEPAEEVLEEFKKLGFDPEDTTKVEEKETKVAEDEIFDLSLMMDDYSQEYSEKDDSSSKNIMILKEFLKENKSELRKKMGLKESESDTLKGEEEALKMITGASDDGSPEALHLLGRFYSEGIGYKKDRVKATEYFLRAVRLGSYKSIKPVWNLIGTKEFFSILKKRIDRGETSAMYVWAALTAFGLDFQLSSNQALDLLKKASSGGHIPSLIETGLCYLSGTLVEKNENKARTYFEDAMKSGSLEAEIRLRIMDLKETGDANKLEKAASFISDASNKGSLLAQTALAFCYENGLGIKMNKAKAVQLYRSAATRGDEKAFNSLKRMFDEVRPEGEEFKIYE
ncbi:MAG: SEL1-like repeat protein [Ignavibacteria bacterium]|nr:SEL1-like repeat protein [Ignavibacteria bacterium]